MTMTDDIPTQFALTQINAGMRALQEANDIYSVLDVRSVAMAAVAFYEAQGACEAANVAKELQLRAERKAGQIWKEMPKNKGTRGQLVGPGTIGGSMMEPPIEGIPTLADLDIDKHESFRWQLEAEVPVEVFEEYLDDKRAKGHELTAGGLIRIAMQLRAEETKATAPQLTGKYRVIYADPPWKYSDAMFIDGYKVSAEMHYPPMTIDELCTLPVKEMAEDNAVLFLWVTSPILEEAFKVIHAWGFEYKTSFVWDKVKHNFGHYNSVRHEFLLVCTRGSCTPDNPKLYDSVLSIEKSDKHSEKPEEFRAIIDDLYTHGNKIELFARKRIDGWEAYGNELG